MQPAKWFTWLLKYSWCFYFHNQSKKFVFIQVKDSSTKPPILEIILDIKNLGPVDAFFMELFEDLKSGLVPDYSTFNQTVTDAGPAKKGFRWDIGNLTSKRHFYEFLSSLILWKKVFNSPNDIGRGWWNISLSLLRQHLQFLYMPACYDMLCYQMLTICPSVWPLSFVCCMFIICNQLCYVYLINLMLNFT